MFWPQLAGLPAWPGGLSPPPSAWPQASASVTQHWIPIGTLTALGEAAVGLAAALALTIGLALRHRETRHRPPEQARPGPAASARQPRQESRAASRASARDAAADGQLSVPARDNRSGYWTWSPALGTGGPGFVLPPGHIPIGIRDRQDAFADIAALGGLGLTGPGAPSAARAMLATLISLAQPGLPGLPGPVVVPGDVGLLPAGTGSGGTLLSRPPTLAGAMDQIEVLSFHLARVADEMEGTQPAPPPAVPAALLAVATPDDTARLRGITVTGRALGVIVILLGQWPDGVTCTVGTDGTITGITPPGTGLDGIRLFQLSTAEAAAAAGLAADQAGPHVPDEPGGEPQAAPQLPGLTPPAGYRQAGRHQVPGTAGTEPGTRAAPAGEGGSPDSGSAAARPARVSVLGPLRITAGQEEISAGFRKARELLAFLAVCGPQGASSDALTEALWPGASPGHGARQRNLTLRKTRDLLRRHAGSAAAMWVLLAGDRYRLDQDLISVDLWEFRAALDAAREAADDAGRLAACQQAVALYRGPLCEGAGYEWAEPHAEAVRRTALDAWTRIAEILQETDHEQALTALESAAIHDPHNEDTYLRIMRMQAAAGRADAARRTYQLLLTRLREIDLTGPRPAVRQAAAELLGDTGPQPGTAGRFTATHGR